MVEKERNFGILFLNNHWKHRFFIFSDLLGGDGLIKKSDPLEASINHEDGFCNTTPWGTVFYPFSRSKVFWISGFLSFCKSC